MVTAHITDWKYTLPEGKILKIIGNKEETETQIHAILEEFNLPYYFSKIIENEAIKISKEIVRIQPDYPHSFIVGLLNTLLVAGLGIFIATIFGFLIGIFWLTYLSQIGILSFIDTFSCFFGPLFGVVIADYYLIKNQNLSNKDLYS